MAKKEVEKDVEKEAAKKYFISDVSDRDFRGNGYDVVLIAHEKKEVSEEVYNILKKEFPYLTVSEE